MRIKIPKNKEIEKILRAFVFKKVAENTTSVTYEGGLGITFSRAQLGMDRKEFAEYSRKIELQGGGKSKRGENINIDPQRKKLVAVRLSDTEYDLFKKAAKEANLTPTQLLRAYIASGFYPYLKIKQTKEESRELGIM